MTTIQAPPESGTAQNDWAYAGGTAAVRSSEVPVAPPHRRADETDAGSGPGPDDRTADDQRTSRKKRKDHRPQWLRDRSENREIEGRFETYPHLLATKPRQGYIFHSDYFQVDESVATILAYVHDDAAHDQFPPFWGIDRVPDLLPDSVTTTVLEQVVRQSDKWVEQHLKQADRLDSADERDSADAASSAARRRSAKISADVAEINAEIADGATYLQVASRLLVKAPSLEVLDQAMERVRQLYIDRFGTLRAAARMGEQRSELSALLSPNSAKRGKPFGFTSSELAGSYSLVTNGIDDATGEYVGYLIGDMNNAAVLLDCNKYSHHLVVADQSVSPVLDRAHVSDMWCSKISQSALLADGKVVHLVLDGADLDKLGPRFDGLTSRVDLGSGDINMFEMFGEYGDEMAVFSTQIDKLKLMFSVMHPTGDADSQSIMEGALERTLTDFYVDQRMWTPDAKHNRDRLRVVGIPHDQVPRLQMFKSYLDTAFRSAERAMANYSEQVKAYDVLRSVAESMLSTNGDLFNNFTASAVDGVSDSRRVVYDLSRLVAARGVNVAMAQLVNVIGYAIGELGVGDTVIIHGTEHIDPRVKTYLSGQFQRLWDRGGRVVFGYNDIDRMIADQGFNRFDAADWTVLGPMRDTTVDHYQDALHRSIPPDLVKQLTSQQSRDEGISYIHRGVTNVVVHLDLALGINPAREAQRRAAVTRAAEAAKQARVDSLMDPRGQAPGSGTSSTRSAEVPASGPRRLARTGGSGGRSGTATGRRQDTTTISKGGRR